MSSSAPSTVPKKTWIPIIDRVTKKWTVTTSELCFNDDKKEIWSPLFYMGTEQWKLKFCRSDKYANFMSCFLYLLSSKKLGILIKFNVSISKSNNTIAEKSLTHKFDKLEGYGWPGLVELSKLLDSDGSEITVTIRCDTDASLSKQRLAENFCCLFKDPKFSDITIIVGDDKFPAHKNILSVRSSVFAAMFEHRDMVENRKNEVDIEDMEPEVVKGMLEYIYTGEVGDLEALADGLLGAAEKYDLEILKASCEETLHKNLDVNNAPGTLSLAHLYRADRLKRLTIEFIKDNLYDVIQTDEYKQINDPGLLREIIAFGVEKK